MSKIIATAAINGAHKIAAQAEDILKKAVEQKGRDAVRRPGLFLLDGPEASGAAGCFSFFAPSLCGVSFLAALLSETTIAWVSRILYIRSCFLNDSTRLIFKSLAISRNSARSFLFSSRISYIYMRVIK